MNKDLKQKWVEALRSGKYKQGRWRLKNNNDEHCCLGVFCDLVDPTQWHVSQQTGYPLYGSENSESYPPIILAKLFETEYPLFEYVISEKLAKMNDEGSSFEEIADWIEENLPAEDTPS